MRGKLQVVGHLLSKPRFKPWLGMTGKLWRHGGARWPPIPLTSAHWVALQSLACTETVRGWCVYENGKRKKMKKKKWQETCWKERGEREKKRLIEWKKKNCETFKSCQECCFSLLLAPYDVQWAIRIIDTLPHFHRYTWIWRGRIILGQLCFRKEKLLLGGGNFGLFFFLHKFHSSHDSHAREAKQTELRVAQASNLLPMCLLAGGSSLASYHRRRSWELIKAQGC